MKMRANLIKLGSYCIKEIVALVIFIPGMIFLKYFQFKKTRLIIMDYHNFSKYNNYKINRGSILETSYGKNFEKQIRFIKKYFHFSYPNEYFDDNCEKGMNILVTFDDGYKDNYDIAVPILKENGAKCIFFISTDVIGTENWLWHDRVHYLINNGKLNKFEAEQALKNINKKKGISQSFINIVDEQFTQKYLPRLMMNWKEIIEIMGNGFKIGAHTSSHKVLSILDYHDQNIQIADSIDKLEEKLNFRTKCFAYPNGSFNDDTVRIIKNCEIDYGFSSARGINKQSQDKLKLKRIGFNASDSIPLVVLKFVISRFRKNLY